MPDLAVVIGLACLLGVGLLHWRLSRTRAAWPGALVPALWGVLVVVAAVTGRVENTTSYLMAAFVAVVLVRMWTQGREAATARLAEASSR
jgi:hypothetical protein